MTVTRLKFELRIVCWRSIEAKIPGERFLDLFSTFSLDGHNSKKVIPYIFQSFDFFLQILNYLYVRNLLMFIGDAKMAQG